ncbi:oligosaccharide flippase family protein [Morganella morganii]|uniref:oligosaccharide flippase family protein n=1 Tax=Morganella morganii TaxID=582 RepID=UPI0034E3E052
MPSIREKFFLYQKQISNFFYLSCLQFVNMILPLITLPFLLHKLGLENYGKVVFSLAIAAYFTIFINFGFNVAITKEISINRHKNKRISNIISSTILIKLVLFLISFIILYIIEHLFFKTHDIIYYYALLICLGELLFPLWYYQGVEKMKYITLINSSIKILFTILIFILITKKEDYIYVPLLQGISGILGGIIGLLSIFTLHKIKISLPSLLYIKPILKKGVVFLITDTSAVIKDKTNIIAIGTVIDMSALAYYDLAEKIVWAFRSIFSNITNAFFPFFAKEKNKNDVKTVIKISLYLSIFAYIVLIIFSGKIILLLSSPELLPAQPLLYIMGLYVVIATLSGNIGQSVLIVNSLYKEMIKNLLITTILYLIMLSILVYLKSDIILFSSIYIISVAFELTHRVFICKKYNLLNWIY